MGKRKKILIGIAVVLIIAAAAASAVAYRNYRIYHATYILIDEKEYRRDSTELDLSGQPVVELEKIKELSSLKRLNLRGTGITIAQYDDLRSALPKCEILWSVPFQNRYLDNTFSILSIDSLKQEDLPVLEYFPNLSRINAGRCRDYGPLFALMEQRPDLYISYSITLSGRDYYNNSQTLDVTDPDVDEILEKLGYLPIVQTVNLGGSLPANKELQKLVEAYPEITFAWEFDILGVTTSNLAEFLDLSGVQMENTTELENALPYMPHLTQVDMVDCGISNEDMDALNKRHENIKFVWSVNICGKTFRTDIQFFMPVKYHLGGVTGRSCANLKYCEDIQAMDFGHYKITDVEFIKYLPNLKYLLLCDAKITDLTTIGNCASLEYLEFFMTPAVDLWPLANLTNLRDLNLSRTPFDEHRYEAEPMGDITPLLQMTWLDRLWLADCDLTDRQVSALRRTLTDTILIFESEGCTTSGFRYTPRYYQQRDILDMYYSHN